MFRKEPDFEAFERVTVEVHQRQPIRILSYCVLSNHWHFVVKNPDTRNCAAKQSTLRFQSRFPSWANKSRPCFSSPS